MQGWLNCEIPALIKSIKIEPKLLLQAVPTSSSSVLNTFYPAAPCSDPGDLQYGRKYGSNFLHGNQVSYTCLGRYMLEGATRLTCNNGRWDRPRPSCKGEYVVIQFCWRGKTKKEIWFFISVIINPSIKLSWCQSFLPSSIILLFISVLIPDDWFHSLGNKIIYLFISLTKIAPCSDPGSPAKGNKRGNDYRHGKSVSYTCQSGTRLMGRSSSTCNNGAWSSPLPSCLGKI